MSFAARIMSAMRFATLTAVLLALVALPAAARDCKGVSFADSIEVADGKLVLNGLGLRKATILKISVYVAALYVAKPTRDPRMILNPGTAFELTLHFLRAVSAAELGSRFEAGFQKNSASQLPALQTRITTLNSWMTAMAAGQRMTFIHHPSAGVAVEIDGRSKGTIPGDDFATALLSIWLGAEPPNTELKNGLLGGSCD